eukprot:1143736-Pelagomonas_calceolata.AAC.2
MHGCKITYFVTAISSEWAGTPLRTASLDSIPLAFVSPTYWEQSETPAVLVGAKAPVWLSAVL